MATFRLTITTDSAAFYDAKDQDVFAPEQELSRLIKNVAIRVGEGSLTGTVRDINGHTCGTYTQADDDEERIAARDRVIAYLNEMDRVQSLKPQYDDASHVINLIPLNRSDIRMLIS